ncbi:MAG: hypothetical protein IJP48_00600 [Synergistaceae bacterium]|nr:hypothetical protein [Synergistaceae bacterium]
MIFEYARVSTNGQAKDGNSLLMLFEKLEQKKFFLMSSVAQRATVRNLISS